MRRREAVPISMGSSQFTTVELDAFRLTYASFPPATFLPSHVHDRTTFAVMLDGSFDLLFPGKTYECPPCTIFTEPVGDVHANRIQAGGARVLVLQPDPARTELFRPCAAVLDRINHFRHGTIFNIASRLLREIRTRDSVSSLAMEALGLEMLAVAARLDSSQRVESPPPPWLLRAQELIHSQFRDTLRISEVARIIGVHPVHLARVFRYHYRVPLGSYIRSLRVEWAAEQLIGTDASIAAIAHEAGFSDQSHFTREFKRQLGIPPGRYRKERRTC